jgi:hypothetical protein
MGTFHAKCKIENPTERSRSVVIPKLLVDTDTVMYSGSKSWATVALDPRRAASGSERLRRYTAGAQAGFPLLRHVKTESTQAWRADKNQQSLRRLSASAKSSTPRRISSPPGNWVKSLNAISIHSLALEE